MFFNSNIFYGTTNFAFSNIFAKTSINETYNKSDVLFIDEKQIGPKLPEWRNSSTQTEGIEITSFSNH